MIVLKEKLYTSEETSEILGVTTRTLYRYVKNNEIIPETKTKSGTFRFNREEIYKYLYPTKFEKILELIKKREEEMGENKYSYVNHLTNVPGDSNNILSTNPEPSVEKPIETSDSKLVEDNESVDEEKEVSPALENASKEFDDALKNLENTLKNTQKETTNSIQPEQVLPTTSKDIPDASVVMPPIENTVNPVVPVKETIDIDVSNTLPIEDTSKNDATATSLPKLEPVADIQEVAATDQKTTSDSIITSDTKSAAPAEVESVNTQWNYYINADKSILDLAREINSLANETGRRYAATMQGGLSLHHDIDEFKTVHFYIENDDLNWWVQQLGLAKSDQNNANICLIPTNNAEIFGNSYKLRGLFVVEDQQLIQDLMKHGEKDLARSLL